MKKAQNKKKKPTTCESGHNHQHQKGNSKPPLVYANNTIPFPGYFVSVTTYHFPKPSILTHKTFHHILYKHPIHFHTLLIQVLKYQKPIHFSTSLSSSHLFSFSKYFHSL